MHLRRLGLLVLALAAIALAGCGGGGTNSVVTQPDTPGTGTATVRGYVYSPNGSTPIAGAQCTLATRQSSSPVFTDANGFFQFTNVAAGPKTLTVTAGVLSFTQQLTVADGATMDVGTTTNPIKLGTGSSIAHMAVIEGSFDNIQGLLTDMGFPQQTTYDANASGWVLYNEWDTNGHAINDLLMNAAELAKYKMVFINCGSDESLAEDATVQTNLRNFVRNGGMLYASDWAYDFVEMTWPLRIDFYGDDTVLGAAQDGYDGLISAQINAPLSTMLGKTSMDINYDLGAWAMIDNAPQTDDPAQSVTVLVEGPRPSYQGFTRTLGHGVSRTIGNYPTSGRYPMMVQFTDGNGKVVYTSFHNEAQATADMKAVLSRIALGGI